MITYLYESTEESRQWIADKDSQILSSIPRIFISVKNAAVLRSSIDGQQTTQAFAQSLDAKIWRDIVVQEAPDMPRVKELVDQLLLVAVEPSKGLSAEQIEAIRQTKGSGGLSPGYTVVALALLGIGVSVAFNWKKIAAKFIA